MSYLAYSLFLTLFAIVTVLWVTRHQWLQHIPPAHTLPYPFNIRYAPLSPITPLSPSGASFADDAAAGLHSSTFDLSGNIESGDGRGGLDERAKNEIRRVMKQRGIGFDEARRAVVVERFRREGIGADGRPKDPKFVSFS